MQKIENNHLYNTEHNITMTEQSTICSLKPGDSFIGFLLAQEVSFKTSSKGSEYLELKLADTSGCIKAFLWDIQAIEGNTNQIAADAFLLVKGQVSNYNGRTQLRLDKVRFAQDNEVGALSSFFPTSQRPIDMMIAELDSTIASIRDPWIIRLVESIFIETKDLRDAFCKAPAAKVLHHAYLGGLLEHTLSMIGMAEMACRHYTKINRDLVVAGVLLHDLGKTAELTYKRSFGYSDIGGLIGHISIAADWINRAIIQIPDFPEELRILILHIILSHHGKLEYGSPIIPKTPEATLVHYLDDMDAKLEVAFHSIMEDNGSGTWTQFSKGLECALYKPRWPESINNF
jgi:3'-5' exoribonuclease